MIKLEMKNYNTILIEKQPKYQLYHQTKFVNMSILLVKIYYHSNKQQIIEQAKFTYSPLAKAFVKQIKTIEDQGEKQVKALNTLKSGSNNNNNNKLTIEDVIPENVFANDEATKEFNKIIEIEKNVDREKLVYKSNQNIYNFKKYQTIRTFGKDIYNDEITLEEADKD